MKKVQQRIMTEGSSFAIPILSSTIVTFEPTNDVERSSIEETHESSVGKITNETDTSYFTVLVFSSTMESREPTDDVEISAIEETFERSAEKVESIELIDDDLVFVLKFDHGTIKFTKWSSKNKFWTLYANSQVR